MRPLILTCALLFGSTAVAQRAAPTTPVGAEAYGSDVEAYEQLLDYAVPFARQMLAEVGTFAPFGLALTDRTLIPVQLESEQHGPHTAMMTAQILRGFAAEGIHFEGQPDQTVRAAAVVADILTSVPGRPGRTDAVSVMMERADGAPMAYVLPYTRDEAGSVVYLTPFWRPQSSLIFVAAPSAGKP